MKTAQEIMNDPIGVRLPGHYTTLSETACNLLSTWFPKVGPSARIDGDAWLLFRDTKNNSIILSDHGRGYCTFYVLDSKWQTECGFETTYDTDAEIRCSDRASFVEFCRASIARYELRERMTHE